MTAISPQAGLLRYVRQQGGRAPPSGGVRTRLWPAAHIWREKSNFKFGIYLYLTKFYSSYIKPYVFVTSKFLKFKNLRIFLTVNHCFASACVPLLRRPRVSRLFRFKTFLYNLLAFGRTSAKLHFCVDLVFLEYLGLRHFLMIETLTVARLRNSNMIKNYFKTRQLYILHTD